MYRVLGLFCLVSVTAQGAVFDYELTGYPADAGSCHEQARRLGEDFARATGKEVVQAICAAEQKGLRTHRIRYRSDKALRAVSTVASTFMHDPSGRYETEKDCVDALDSVRRQFEDATDLKATFSYCTPDRLGRTFPWAPRVDGFGNPTLEPFVSGYLIFGVPKQITGTQYRDRIRTALNSLGAVYSDLVLHSKMAYARVSVHYYAEKRLSFSLEEPTKTDNEAQCLAQLPQYEAIYRSTTNPPALVYCGRIHVGGQYELNAVFIEGSPLRTRRSVESYDSYKKCEADRERLVRFYQQELGHPVQGGLCSRVVEERVYRVVLFEP